MDTNAVGDLLNDAMPSALNIALQLFPENVLFGHHAHQNTPYH